MIRPEVRQMLVDWKEIILGASFAVIGGNWMLRGHLLLPYIGLLLITLGLIFLWIGWRRIRFPTGKGGIGVVEVTERQITYLTAGGGAAISIEHLQRVEVQTGTTGLIWTFTADGGDQVTIPGGAPGAEKLFDALVPLPGINYDQAARAARAPESMGDAPDKFLIWQKDRRALH